MRFSSMWSLYSEIYAYENKFLAQKDHLTGEEALLLDEVMVQVKKLPNANHLNQIEYRSIEFEKKLGTGKFGMVFLGNLGNRAVAVKQLLPKALNHSCVMQFVREIHVMSNLKHPHVLEYIGAVLSVPHICLVTECASRGSLKHILRSSSLSWRTEKRRYLIQICSGMNYLHTREQPVLHRDLKADNCLVTSDFLVKISG